MDESSHACGGACVNAAVHALQALMQQFREEDLGGRLQAMATGSAPTTLEIVQVHFVTLLHSLSILIQCHPCSPSLVILYCHHSYPPGSHLCHCSDCSQVVVTRGSHASLLLSWFSPVVIRLHCSHSFLLHGSILFMLVILLVASASVRLEEGHFMLRAHNRCPNIPTCCVL
jgi:hypothetical protein